MRSRTLTLLSLGPVMFLASVIHPGSTGAQEDDSHQDEPTSSTTIPPGAISIGDGMAFTGGVVTAEGEPTQNWNANRAAVFVQSWIGEAIFGETALQDPPADLPVHRIDIGGTWGYSPGWMTIYYASDGETAWVSLPPGQPKRPTQAGTPPAPSAWFVANPRAIGAFEGTEELIQTPGVDQGTSTTAPAADGGGEASGSTGNEGDDQTWLALAVVALVVVVGAVLILRRRPAPST